MVFSSGVVSFINVVGNALIHNYVVIVKNDNDGMAFHSTSNAATVFDVDFNNISETISNLYAEISDSNVVWVEADDKLGTSFLARFVLYVIVKSRRKAHEGDPNWCISVPALYEREFGYIEELIPSWNADDKTFVAQIKKCVKLLK